MPIAPGLGLALALALVTWRPVRPGIERTEFVAGPGALARVRVIALRLDPCRVRLAPEERARLSGLRGAWTVDSMPVDALLAFNGGQFSGGTPWGWYVRDGVEQHPPGTGSLAMALTVTEDGGVALVPPDEIAARRGKVRHAIQSYPMLLLDGVLPLPLRAPGRGVDLEHRDTRLAIGTAADGKVIIAMTRFEGIAGQGATLPYGPTLPELAGIMRRLGAVRAVGLDGGLSSQLAVRDADGDVMALTNWRMVPVGMVGYENERGCR